VNLEQFLDPGKLGLQPGELHPHFIVNGALGVSSVSSVNGVSRGASAFSRRS
jgi:hypothetical protein